jgi:hypothetical protein
LSNEFEFCLLLRKLSPDDSLFLIGSAAGGV